MRTYDLTNMFLQSVAQGVDMALNGKLKGEERKTGFCLLVFPMGGTGIANYVSNGADRADMVKLLRTTADSLEQDAKAPEGVH